MANSDRNDKTISVRVDRDVHKDVTAYCEKIDAGVGRFFSDAAEKKLKLIKRKKRMHGTNLVQSGRA
jgi:hypothetical protein